MAYSKTKTKQLRAQADELGIITRSNMTGEKIEEKINLLNSGTPLDQINPAPRGSKSGTAKKTTARKTAAPKAAAPAKTAAAKPATRKAPAKSAVSTFALYSVSGKELAYLVDFDGVTGEDAAVEAVKANVVQANVPLIALPATLTDDSAFVVQAEVRTEFSVGAPVPAEKAAKPAAKAPAAAKAAAPAPAAPTPTPAAPAAATAAKTSARKTSARKTTAAPAPAAVPAVSTGNPFAE